MSSGVSFLYKFARFVLFFLDAEVAHHFILRIFRFLAWNPRFRRVIALGAPRPQQLDRIPFVWGMPFYSRLGLAAGFDKNADFVPLAPRLGFGFVEIGTVTPRPQSGNARPRLFREVENQNLFNRMGFNNHGAAVVAQSLKKAKLEGDLPIGFRVGVNIGKNKETSSEEAHLDYAKAIAPFEGMADYVVINVSSPNTPGLRDLQNVDALQKIFDAVQVQLSAWKQRPPLLFKLAPEIEGQNLQNILKSGESWGVSGWVLTNTWGGEWRLGSGETLPGGWSGQILKTPARLRLQEARTQTKLPIISVGGIMDVEEAKERLKLGADLIQVYSGWVYQGPAFISDVSKAILGSVSQ